MKVSIVLVRLFKERATKVWKVYSNREKALQGVGMQFSYECYPVFKLLTTDQQNLIKSLGERQYQLTEEEMNEIVNTVDGTVREVYGIHQYYISDRGVI